MIYDNLDIIGLRSWFDPGEQPESAVKKQLLKYKFYCYITFMLVSIYWVSFFN
jgi:hypothetical protein